VSDFIPSVPDDIGIVTSRSRAGKKAKNKGSSFERRIGKSLEGFWDSKFFRTPMSGGSALKYDYNLAGDLSTPDETWPFHVECKNQEALGKFFTIFTSDKCPVWKWWNQTVEECPENKIPLLIFTKNYFPVFCLMKASFWFSIDHPTMDPSAELEHSAILFVREVVVVTLDRFLSVGKEKCLNASKSFLDVTCQ
jgi:hypothetical protein